MSCGGGPCGTPPCCPPGFPRPPRCLTRCRRCPKPLTYTCGPISSCPCPPKPPCVAPCTYVCPPVLCGRMAPCPPPCSQSWCNEQGDDEEDQSQNNCNGSGDQDQDQCQGGGERSNSNDGGYTVMLTKDICGSKVTYNIDPCGQVCRMVDNGGSQVQSPCCNGVLLEAYGSCNPCGECAVSCRSICAPPPGCPCYSCDGYDPCASPSNCPMPCPPRQPRCRLICDPQPYCCPSPCPPICPMPKRNC